MSGEKTDWLSSSVSGRRVKQLKFDIDTDNYSNLMNLFIRSNSVDTDFGYKSLEMSSSKTPSSRPINIVFDKRTSNEVAIHDGHQLYEIGFQKDGCLRHFKNAYFTEFGYPEMVGCLLVVRINGEVFRNAVMVIMDNPGDCEKWAFSAGVLALMIGDAGRVSEIRRIMRTLLCLDKSITLDGKYAWIAKMPLRLWELRKINEAKDDDTDAKTWEEYQQQQHRDEVLYQNSVTSVNNTSMRFLLLGDGRVECPMLYLTLEDREEITPVCMFKDSAIDATQLDGETIECAWNAQDIYWSFIKTTTSKLHFGIQQICMYEKICRTEWGRGKSVAD